MVERSDCSVAKKRSVKLSKIQIWSDRWSVVLNAVRGREVFGVVGRKEGPAGPPSARSRMACGYGGELHWWADLRSWTVVSRIGWIAAAAKGSRVCRMRETMGNGNAGSMSGCAE